MSNHVQLLTEALTAGWQDVENALWQLLTERSVDTAIGTTLAGLGKIVGQPNVGGDTDEIYRRYVRAKIAVNKSQGRREDLLTVARLVLGTSEGRLVIERYGDAAYAMRVEDLLLEDDVIDVLVRMIHDATMEGVKSSIEYPTSLTEPFRTPPTFLTGNIVSVSTSAPVTDTSVFPPAGTAVVNPGIGTPDSGTLNDEDSFTYTGKTATTLTGVSGLAGNHTEGAAVIPLGWVGEGLSDESDLTVGGEMYGVVE